MGRVLPLLSAALATGLLLSPAVGASYAPWDVGELHFYSRRILDGAVPGRDYVVSAYGPLNYGIAAVVLSFGGSVLLHWDWLFLVLRIGATLVLLRIGQHVGLGAWAVLPPILAAAVPGPLHKASYVLAATVVGWLFVTAGDRRIGEWRRGVVLAPILAVRPDLFAFAIGGITVLRGSEIRVAGAEPSTGRELARCLGRWAGPGLMVALLWLLSLWLRDDRAPGLVFGQVLRDALANQRIAEPRFPGPVDLLRGIHPDGLWLWLLPFAAGTLLLTWFRGRTSRAVALPLLLFLAVVANQVRMKADLSHLLQTGPALWLVAVVVVRAWTGAAAITIRRAVAVGLALAPVAFGAALVADHPGDPYAGGVALRGTPARTMWTALGPLRVAEETAQWLEPALLWMRDVVPEGPIWVPTYQPLLPALAGRPTYGAAPGLLYWANDDAGRAALLDDLDRGPPAAVLFIDDSPEGPALHLGIAAPELKAWMDRNTRITRRFGPAEARRLVPSDGGIPGVHD